MPKNLKRKSIEDWNGESISLGEGRDVVLAVGESYSGVTVEIPLHIRRGEAEGPVVFVTAALHGDEINGTGVVRALLQDEQLTLRCGALILVPVLNLLAFERHSRYLPDRRDLNRCFPGSVSGSLASRLANAIFSEIVCRSDYGIDLHTAAVRRTNYPSVRGDLTDQAVRMLAESFGGEVILNGKGPTKSLRREASLYGCPTIVYEGGEVWKVEPGIVETATRGVKNVLHRLEMLDGPSERPEYHVIIERTKWIRAERGGFLHFHVSPGDIVEQGQPLATNATLLGREQSILIAPFPAIVLGMTTLPTTSTGEPVCHLGRLPIRTKPRRLRKLREKDKVGLAERVVEDLSSNVMVVERSDDMLQ